MKKDAEQVDLLFSDFFNVSQKTVERHGAFDISLIADLPLFVDPFLLFNSRKRKYRKLHDQMIDYLRFLRDKSADEHLDPGLIRAWYFFPEIRQNWLGFSLTSNRGRGLGKEFANALHINLGKLFRSFGDEEVTKGSHLEKLCLIRDGVGRDNISDFTNNLTLEFLLDYTQQFANRHIDRKLRRTFTINKVRFNYQTESWEPATYDLPCFRGDYVLLTPRDVLTKDDTWINKGDLIREFDAIPNAIPNAELRAQVNNYFRKLLPKRPKKEDTRRAKTDTLIQFPELIDYFIKYKEDRGEQAESIASAKVNFSKLLYLHQFTQLPQLLKSTDFYIFYVNGKPIEREEDLHILYRMTWFASTSDVTREANDGRGPVDFKVSLGSRDKTLVEFKLASNNQLKRNLRRQAPVYEKASNAKKTIKVIVYFTAAEKKRVDGIVKALKMTNDRNIVLVDARKDNKPSGSKA